MIIRARNEIAFNNRSILHGTKELDLDILATATRRFKDEEESATLFFHLSLSGWSSELLFNIGRVQNCQCPCGFHTQSLVHILWHCPLHSEARHKDPRIADICDLELPLSLRLGLPPALGAELRGPLWDMGGPSDEPSRTRSRESYERILSLLYGPDYKKPDNFKCFTDGERFYDDHVPHNPELSKQNARQIVAGFKGPYRDPVILEPAPFDERLEGVAEFGAFSDGSLTAPSVPKWGIAGCALYHPERDILTSPLQPNEVAECRIDEPEGSPYTVHCVNHPEGKGIILHHFIPGCYCSSTRAEIYPVILALSCRRAIRLATDSANMLRQLTLLIDNPFYKPSKPWNLLPDGDLWQFIQQMLIHLGRTVVCKIIDVGKVKAHTDKIPGAIENGIITLYPQICNKVADQYAPPSHEHSPNQLCSNYASACYMRSKVYVDFVEVILQMIIRVVDSDRKARAESIQLAIPTGLRKAVAGVVVSPRLPADPGMEEPMEIEPMWPHPFLHHDTGDNIIQVFHFLRCIRLRPVVYPQSGASWLELFCLFELLGGSNYRDPNEFLPGMMCTFAKDFNGFKLCVHKLLDHINPPMCDFFKPNKAGPGVQNGPRLHCIGITDFLPCIAATIVYDDEGLHNDMLKCLLSCNKKLTAIQLQHLFCDDQPLQVKSFKVNMWLQAPAWRELRLARTVIQDDIASYVPDFASPDSGHNVMPVIYMLMCPRCNHPKDAVRLCLYSSGIYSQISCTNPVCMQSTISKNWKCPCKVPWAKCSGHAAQGFTIAAEARGKLDSRASNPRPKVMAKIRHNVVRLMPDDHDVQLVSYPCTIGRKAALAVSSFHSQREAFLRCSSNNVELPKAVGDRIDPRLSHCIPLTYDRQRQAVDNNSQSTLIASSSTCFVPATANYVAREDGVLLATEQKRSSTSSSSNSGQIRPADVPVSLGLQKFTSGRSAKAKARPKQQSRQLQRDNSDDAARAFYDRRRNFSSIQAHSTDDIASTTPDHESAG